jgi:hypothetical protein
MPLAFAANWFIYQVVLMPLVRRAKNRAMLEVDSILATFGLLFVLQGIMLVVFGGQFYTYTYLSVPVDILGSTVALNRLIALVFASVIGTGLYLALTRTRQGSAPSRPTPSRHKSSRSTCARPRPSRSRLAARWSPPAVCWSRRSRRSRPRWASSSP